MFLRNAAAAALPLLLAASVASAETAALPAEKLFPFLQAYYNMPSAQRDHFQMAYFMAIKGDAKSVTAAVKHAEGDVALAIASNGRITPLPSADDLKNKRQIALTAPKGTSIGITIKLVPNIVPAATLDAAYLAVAIAQAHDGAKKAAGLLSLAVPDYKTVCFDGAPSGTAVLKSGKSVALKVQTSTDAKASVCFTPSDTPDAVQIKFERAPSAIYIVPRPK